MQLLKVKEEYELCFETGYLLKDGFLKVNYKNQYMCLMLEANFCFETNADFFH